MVVMPKPSTTSIISNTNPLIANQDEISEKGATKHVTIVE